MRNALILALGILVWGSAAYAQEPKGYIEGAAGMSTITGTTTGNANGEVGIRVAPRVMLFGNIGRTADVVANGLFTAPNATTSLMLKTGGGVQVPLAKHLLGNVGYSVSRISADTPIHAQDLTFGVGLKF